MPQNFLHTNAANPPLELAPTAIHKAFAKQAGHIALFCSLRLWLLGGLFQICGQTIERPFPEFPIFLDPLRRLFERLGVQLHFVHASVAPPPQQSGFLQNAQMFRNRWQRHRVRPRQMRHALIATGEMGEDAAAGRIGQSRERPVECF